ncbi:MAG TPA: hypothetical protein VGV57_07635 [Thermoleophilaceae bacterium]|nr:hypothetical protein [Thermoleophilaceae bacterium]
MSLALGDPLPDELEIVDASGESHRLSAVAGGEPTLLIHLRHLG